MIMLRYPWRNTASPDTRSARNHDPEKPWIQRQWNLSSFLGLQSQPEQEIPCVTCAPTPTTISSTQLPLPRSPLLDLPAELRQKILRYTVTDEEILKHLLYESVQTSAETWEARVYYFDGREFAWDDETKVFSRAPFNESQALELVHPLMKEDMEYVKRQWIKRVRAIGEEKRVEVMKTMKGKDGKYRGFGESSRFPKADMKKSVLSLMMGARA